MTTYTENCSRSIVGRPDGSLETLTRILRHWLQNQQLRFQVAQERRQLLEMSDAMLRDLGITRGEAEAEALKMGLPAGRLNQLARGKC